MEKLIDSIKKHEGNPGVVYKDSEGYLTCGWGHCLSVGSRVPPEAAEAFLKQDVADAIKDFFRLAPALGSATVRKLNAPRRRVIVEMLFNLGYPRTLKFRKMWAAIGAGDWEEAAAQMLDSKWAGQVKGRARVLAEIMRTGEES